MALVSPATFADNDYSGFFGQGDMQKEFEEASFALKPGEISPVIETASGLHLIERYVHVLSTPPAPQAPCLCGFCIPRSARRFRRQPLASNASSRSRIVALTRLFVFQARVIAVACRARLRLVALLLTGHLPDWSSVPMTATHLNVHALDFAGGFVRRLGKMNRIQAKGNVQNANVNIEMLSLIVLDARRLLARISEFALSVPRPASDPTCFPAAVIRHVSKLGEHLPHTSLASVATSTTAAIRPLQLPVHLLSVRQTFSAHDTL